MPNKQFAIMAGLQKPDERTRVAPDPVRSERQSAVIREMKVDLKAAAERITLLEEELLIARQALAAREADIGKLKAENLELKSLVRHDQSHPVSHETVVVSQAAVDEPWKRHGMSKATYYRKKKAGEVE